MLRSDEGGRKKKTKNPRLSPNSRRVLAAIVRAVDERLFPAVAGLMDCQGLFEAHDGATVRDHCR